MAAVVSSTVVGQTRRRTMPKCSQSQPHCGLSHGLLKRVAIFTLRIRRREVKPWGAEVVVGPLEHQRQQPPADTDTPQEFLDAPFQWPC